MQYLLFSTYQVSPLTVSEIIASFMIVLALVVFVVKYDREERRAKARHLAAKKAQRINRKLTAIN